MWKIVAPDGREWSGESALRACVAAQRDTIDPVLAMQRINAALDEWDAEDDKARHDYENYYHKIRAELGLDLWVKVWLRGWHAASATPHDASAT